MKMYKSILMLMLPGLGIFACSKWQEPQIDEQVVEVLVPRDSLHTDIATQLFYWQHVEGAVKYELQIVTPSFDRIDRFILDTNVVDNKFEFTLQPGMYEWRIQAYNFSSSTGYTTHRLFIDSTLDLTNQKIVLISPEDRDTSNQTTYLLRWLALYNADSYLLEVYRPNTNGQLVYSNTTTDDNIGYNVSAEGNFEWRVRAVNSTSQTGFSTREFFVDTTAPDQPSLNIPAQGVFLAPGNIDFEWSRSGGNTGASIFDTLYIATDPSFVNPGRAIYSRTGKATADTLSNGIYYWRVRSFDNAGNTGPVSSARQFTIQ